MTPKTNTISVNGIKMGGGNPLFFIGGPCVIESETHVYKMAERLKAITAEVGVPFIFKASYDKANRMSAESYRGPGLKKGLELLGSIKKELGLTILSDVHSLEEVAPASKVLDIIQIPAFLCRQTDLVVAVAKTGRVVNIKKGQFLAPWDVKNIIDKVVKAGNKNVLVTERGVSFGYNNLVSDMRAIPIMQTFGYPVVFDAGHSVQLPGGRGDSSSGMPEMIPVLAKAAVAVGCDGLFLEVHDNPDNALSDGPNMLKLDELPKLLKTLKAIRTAIS